MAKELQIIKAAGDNSVMNWYNDKGSTVSAGTPQSITEANNTGHCMVIVPQVDIASLDVGAVYTQGVFRANKDNTVEIKNCERVFWDVSQAKATTITSASSGDYILGAATCSAGTTDTYVDVQLNFGTSAFEVVDS